MCPSWAPVTPPLRAVGKRLHLHLLSVDLMSSCSLSLLLCFHSVVEFKDEEFVKKAILTMNKHDLNGRPLNIKEVGAAVWSQFCLLHLADDY